MLYVETIMELQKRKPARASFNVEERAVLLTMISQLNLPSQREMNVVVMVMQKVNECCNPLEM